MSGRVTSRAAITAILLLCCWLSPLGRPTLPWTHADPPPVINGKSHPFDPNWLLVENLLQEKCAGCHRGGQTERWDLSSYSAVIAARDEATRAIVPGNPRESLLVEYVNWNVDALDATDAPDTPMMPPLKHDWLTAGQLRTLQRWIEGGALEYRLPSTCDSRPLLETDFPSAQQCRQCHPTQYAQWSRSMHAYAQHSPVFEAFNLTLQERTGGTIGTFCSRCHTPVGTTLGESGALRNVNRSRLSMEGVTCVACHRRSVAAYKSSGRVAIQPGELAKTCMYGPFESSSSSLPGVHPAAEFPYIKSSQFCGECHDVTSPQGVRLEEAFSEWNHSPAAKQGVTCQSCHMGPVQGRPCPDDRRPWGRAAFVPGARPRHCRCAVCRIIPSRVPTTLFCLTRSFRRNSTGCTKSIIATCKR